MTINRHITTRVPSWPAKLFAAIEEHDCAFAPYNSDCARLAFDCVEAITGKDLFEGQGGYPIYNDDASAQAAIKSLGYDSGDPTDIVADMFVEISPAMAQRGDLGVVDWQGQNCLTVCVGGKFVGKLDSPIGGLIHVSRGKIVRAFAVGRDPKTPPMM